MGNLKEREGARGGIYLKEKWRHILWANFLGWKQVANKVERTIYWEFCCNFKLWNSTIESLVFEISIWLMSCLVLCHFHYWVLDSRQPDEVKLLAMSSTGINKQTTLLSTFNICSILQAVRVTRACFKPNSSSSVAIYICIHFTGTLSLGTIKFL